MIDQKIIDLIRSHLQKGISKEIITKEQLQNGREIKEIEDAFKTLETSSVYPKKNSASIPIFNKTNSDTIITQTQINNKKTIFAVILILIVVLVGAYLFYRSEKVDFKNMIDTTAINKKSLSNTTENQNKLPNPYVNDEYHFTFTYPEEITFLNGKSSDYNLLKLDSTYYVNYVDNVTQSSVETKFPLGSMLVGKKTYQQYIEMFKKSKELRMSENKIEKNGLIWNTVSLFDNDNSPAMTIAITEKEGLNYTLFLIGTKGVSGQKELFNLTLEMFLDTFKFTESESPQLK